MTDMRASWFDRLQRSMPGRIASITDGGAVLVRDVRTRAALCRSTRRTHGLTISWDGRLHNRDELRRQLPDVGRGDASDAALALSVYEHAGVDGFRTLVGDWSLAICDASERALYLARDYMGVRPLYYCVRDGVAFWSSHLGELATRCGRDDDLDEAFAAGFMALRFSTDVTPYRGIRAVPCASATRIDASGENRRRFWSLEPATVRYRDRRTYDEQLRALWHESVAARMDEGDSTWAELSGGLDSSSIVCMAADLVNRRAVPSTAIRPISHVAFESPEADERRFIEAVESATGARSTTLSIEQHQDARTDDEWVTPFEPRGIQVASERHVAARGGRVILSGRMGDLIMGCTSDNSMAVLDAFVDGHLVRGVSMLRLWSRSCRKPLVELVSTLACEGMRAACGRLPRGETSAPREAGIALLSGRLQTIAREWRIDLALPPVRWSARPLTAAVLNCSREGRLESRTADGRVTYTYPYAHRPLVEFMLAIPGEERSAPGNTRALMRRAFDGLVPDRILRRRSKGCYPPAAMRAVRRLVAALPAVDDLEIVQRGWCDAARLTTALRAVAQGAGQSGGELQRALILEEWLMRRQRRGRAESQHREEVTTHGVCNA